MNESRGCLQNSPGYTGSVKYLICVISVFFCGIPKYTIGVHQIQTVSCSAVYITLFCYHHRDIGVTDLDIPHDINAFLKKIMFQPTYAESFKKKEYFLVQTIHDFFITDQSFIATIKKFTASSMTAMVDIMNMNCESIYLQLKHRMLGNTSEEEKASFFRAMSKGGGDQSESKSFEVVLLFPIWTTFWTLNGGRGGVTMFQKF